MNILFVHANFPGPYAGLALALAASGHRIVALSALAAPPGLDPAIQVVRFAIQRASAKDLHPWVSEIEAKTIRGEASAQAMLAVGRAGFTPDVIVASSAFGEAMFAKDVFPGALLILSTEFHHTPRGLDAGFDNEFQKPSLAIDASTRLKSALNLMSLDAMDWGIAPTHWQRSTIPATFHSKITVIHEGIDTAVFRPDPSASMRLGRNNHLVRAGDEVVSFVSRTLDPYRGFHIFMRALPDVLRQRPQSIALIVGGKGISFPPGLPDRSNFDRIMDEVKGELDLSRVFFLGRVSSQVLQTVLQVSKVHVALSYPAATSRSLIEAMSAGALVVGSQTPPVQELVSHAKNGILVNFFDVHEFTTAVVYGLSGPVGMQGLRHQARADVVQRYDLKSICLPRQMALISGLGGRRKK